MVTRDSIGNTFPMSPGELLHSLIPIVRAAGRAVMEIYASDFGVISKGDGSPVTLADRHAEAILVEGLQRLTPDIPVIAEESSSDSGLPAQGARVFWLVDPLDGTREFISRNGEFTVNVALIVEGKPVLGLVLVPAKDRLYAGIPSIGAWMEDKAGRRSIRCRAIPGEGLTVVASRSHGDESALDEFLAGRAVAQRIHAGSSLKLCLVATGDADLYPRFGRTMEWDIAAGDAVLRAAGGCVRTLNGDPLRYGKTGFDNPNFVAGGLVQTR